jgi:hypothetical protein
VEKPAAPRICPSEGAFGAMAESRFGRRFRA